MVEVWKPIPGLEGRYDVSNCGRIRNAKTCRVRKTPNGKRGYPVFSIRGGLVLVHRCVAKAFIPNPENYDQVNHKDGNKQNNTVDNLEWCNARQNVLHARKMGLKKSDGDKPVLQILNGKVVSEYKSVSEASRKTNISRSGIGNAIYKRCYNGHHFLRAGGYEWRFKKTQ